MKVTLASKLLDALKRAEQKINHHQEEIKVYNEEIETLPAATNETKAAFTIKKKYPWKAKTKETKLIKPIKQATPKKAIPKQNGRIPCEHCKGRGYNVPTPKYVNTKDVKRMVALMEKHNLTVVQMAKLCEVVPTTFYAWLTAQGQSSGKIRSIYFSLLKLKGYA